MQQPVFENNNSYQTVEYEVNTEKGVFILETGMMPFGKREHPLEAKISALETRQLGFHSLDYEAYVNIFDAQDRLIAGVQLQRRWNHAKMYTLWVDDDFRGLGLGKLLLTHSQDLTLQMDAHTILLETSTLHHYEFYLQNGFELLNAIEEVIPGETFFIMKKDLRQQQQVNFEVGN